MDEKESLIKNHYFEDRDELEKIMNIMTLFRQQVFDPNSQISAIFALEYHIKCFCDKYDLNFIKVRESLMKDAPLNYTEYITNWLFEDKE